MELNLLKTFIVTPKKAILILQPPIMILIEENHIATKTPTFET